MLKHLGVLPRGWGREATKERGWVERVGLLADGVDEDDGGEHEEGDG